MADKRKPKPAGDMVKVILISKMRWNGEYQPLGTVLEMTRLEAADYIALNFVRPEQQPAVEG